MMLKKISISLVWSKKYTFQRKKQGELVMLSSNKNKLDESMMFHRGVAGGVPDFKNLFSESPIHLVFLPPRAGALPDVPLSVGYEAKGSKHVKS